MEKTEFFEANYRKLWLMERVHIPFAFSVSLLQEKWGLPLTGKNASQRFFDKLHDEDKKFFATKRFQEIAVATNAIVALKLPKGQTKKAVREIIAELPTQGFTADIQTLAKEFELEDMWIPYLTVYLITGKITAPDEVLSTNTPPESMLEQYKIFTQVMKKEAQHNFLRSVIGLPATPGKTNPDRESIATLDEDTEYLPDRLIHDSSNIADIIFGKIDEDSLSDDEWSKEGKRRIDKIDQYRKRFRKYCVPLTKENYNRLLTIFNK